MMFPNQIILEENKRLKTAEDKQKLKQIKEDVFNSNLSLSTTMKKYFKTINKYSDLHTFINVSYFNFRAKKINKTVQMKVTKPDEVVTIDGFYYYKVLN